MTVQWNDDQPEQTYDVYVPDAADDDSSLPLVLDAEPIDEAPAPQVSKAPGGSLADVFRAEFGKRTVPTITLRVPGRDGWTMRFRLDWSEAQANRWEEVAQDRSRKNGMNLTKLFRQTVADQCDAILRDGQALAFGSKPFASKELWSLLKEATGVPVGSATQAVELWLPVFPQLQAVATRIAQAAQQENLLDPTDPD